MTGSPHTVLAGNSVRLVMLKVLVALIPGIVAHAWFFGPGIWVSLLLCTLLGVAFEALALLMRGYPLKPFLSDGSTVVTAWLLALSMPTLAPWWLYAVGMLFAILVAKHLYGGLGQNLFNPAMIGFAVLLVSFPVYMTQWPAPVELASHTPDLIESFDLVFAGQGAVSPDAYTTATPLDLLRTQRLAGDEVGGIMAQPAFGVVGGTGHEMVVLMYLLGGLLLLNYRLITWHIPVAFLGTIAVTAGVLQFLDPTNHPDPLFHLTSGGAMLAAFFILTDPVSASATPRGKLIYAGLAGFLVVMIRNYGGYPDGVAFTVLIANMAVPFIDAYTQPRVFGHGRKEKGK
ncbi:MAG: RnfABCDGE type electron transport complex subunit D [Thiobacillaceae bacterium]|jgi:electron transport complex protein RnfD|nr:RnfABCDGE type electron transport complex subunit D [Thiobacillaceae bacterium]